MKRLRVQRAAKALVERTSVDALLLGIVPSLLDAPLRIDFARRPCTIVLCTLSNSADFYTDRPRIPCVVVCLGGWKLVSRQLVCARFTTKTFPLPEEV